MSTLYDRVFLFDVQLIREEDTRPNSCCDTQPFIPDSNKD